MAQILQFDRRVHLTLALPVARSFDTISANVVEIEDLRVEFKVEKSLGKEPNTAEVIVDNLSPARRGQLTQTANGKFILKAGYAEGTAQVFVGDIRQVEHARDGANWRTRITSGDGERAFRFARVNESFRGGTPVVDVVSKLATAMGLASGNVLQAMTGLTVQYVNGYSSFGSVARELTRVLEAHGFSWSIQDGALQVLKDSQHTGVLIPNLTPSSGLIGSPEWNQGDKKKGPFLSARCLLQPRIAPGGLVHLESERYKCDVRVTKVTHTGDTHGQEWYSSFEGKAL
jgi:hypothetical protein